MSRPRGTKRGYVQPSTEVPEEGIFNPHDYIDIADYRKNRHGMMQYEEDLAQIEYLAQLRQQQFALDYQDPKNDALRMRQAGLNPDLVGLSGATAPQGPTSTGGVDMSKYPTNVDQVMKGMSIIDQVSQMTKDFLSGGLQLSDMFMQNLQNESSTISSLFSLQDAMSYRNIYSRDLPLSRRMRRKLESIPVSRTGYIQNAKAASDLFNADVSLMESQAKHWQHVLNPLFNPTKEYDKQGFAITATPEQWVEVWKPLSNWAYEQFGHNAAAAYGKALSDDEYYNTTRKDGTTLGGVRADRELAMDTMQGNQADFMNTLRQPLQQVAKKLKQYADDGNMWASFALIALYFVSNMSFSSSSSNGPNGPSSSHSFGFGN